MYIERIGYKLTTIYWDAHLSKSKHLLLTSDKMATSSPIRQDVSGFNTQLHWSIRSQFGIIFIFGGMENKEPAAGQLGIYHIYPHCCSFFDPCVPIKPLLALPCLSDIQSSNIENHRLYVVGKFSVAAT